MFHIHSTSHKNTSLIVCWICAGRTTFTSGQHCQRFERKPENKAGSSDGGGRSEITCHIIANWITQCVIQFAIYKITDYNQSLCVFIAGDSFEKYWEVHWWEVQQGWRHPESLCKSSMLSEVKSGYLLQGDSYIPIGMRWCLTSSVCLKWRSASLPRRRKDLRFWPMCLWQHARTCTSTHGIWIWAKRRSMALEENGHRQWPFEAIFLPLSKGDMKARGRP